MKLTRLLSILLAAMMVVCVLAFTGCSSEEEEEAAGTGSTKSVEVLNMYIITEDSTTHKAAKDVQKAINEILLPSEKTILNINYLKADEYWDTVDSLLEKTTETPLKRSAKVKGTEKMSFTDIVEYIFKDTTTELELDQEQIDIFVVNDYDKYVELAEDGMLKGLNQYITYDSKRLSTSIYPTVMTAAKVGSETYGIPTNIGVPHGEYTYLVFNEDLLKKYDREMSTELMTFSHNMFESYLAEIKANEPGIWPLSEPFGVAGLEFYNGEPAFMIQAAQFNYMASGCTPALLTKSYVDNIKQSAKYKQLGYYPAEGKASENAKYAIRVETSSELLDGEGEKRWTDEDGTTYIRVLFDIPRVSVEDAFTSVMCISATSPVPDRAMSIIEKFNTNEELANLLQFGIEGVNYEIDELNGDITMLNDTYKMDNLVTGNTYIKHSPTNDKAYFENSKALNQAAAPSGFMGVDYDFDVASENSVYETARVILLEAHEAIENGEDVDEVIAVATAELEALGCVRSSAVDDYGGVFGKIQSSQRSQAQVIGQTFKLSRDIEKYNEDYGIIIKREKKTEEVPADDATATGDETPADEAPADEAPADEVPADEAEAAAE